MVCDKVTCLSLCWYPFTTVKLLRIIRPFIINATLWTSAVLSSQVSAPNAPAIPYRSLTRIEISDLLNWTPSNNLCHGFYQEPPVVAGTPIPGAVNNQPTEITAQGPTILKSQGWSMLNKDVVVTQPGRLIQADTAYIYRDKKTKKVTKIVLIGHVQLQEHGKLIITPKATLYVLSHQIIFNQTIYHISEPTLRGMSLSVKLIYDAWGMAKFAYRDENEVLHLYSVSYTTCSPMSPTWKIHARKLRIDKHEGEAKARDAWITFQHVPIFYSPYLSFPIDNRRRSGFLAPTLGSSKQDGEDISLPYYWNIAPNYDAIFTPEIMTRRGVKFENRFRYLTHHDVGDINFNFIPYDAGFQRFKTNTFKELGSTVPSTSPYFPYINDLHKYNDTRGFLSINNDTTFNSEWSSSLDINYVTDPYYFTDFTPYYNGPDGGISSDQLLNKFDLHYSGFHWQLNALAQAYQTLHIINYAISNPVTNQYIRLPQFDFSAQYPDLWGGVDFGLNGQAVNFLYDVNGYPSIANQPFPPPNNKVPVGQRLHLSPSLSKDFTFPAGYINPAITLDSTSYASQLPNPNFSQNDFGASRNLPVIDVDSGLYLSRLLHFFSYDYIQTFEPRVFYLYVPYLNQNQFPNFDTLLLPFTYDQLFTLNRFTGFDRIENANQFSFALSTRILNPNTGDTQLQAGVGIEYYLQSPRVTLPAGTAFTQVNTSPLVGELTLFPWNHWSVSGNIAWAINQKMVDNDTVSLSYNGGDNKTASLGYTYVNSKLDPTSIDFPGLSRSHVINMGGTWPITQRWSALGYWYYNIGDNHPQSYFGGIEYSTCCWGIRFVANRSWFGTTPGTFKNEYRNIYYVQLLLKGLGSFGNSDPAELLTSSLPGYVDPFRN